MPVISVGKKYSSHTGHEVLTQEHVGGPNEQDQDVGDV